MRMTNPKGRWLRIRAKIIVKQDTRRSIVANCRYFSTPGHLCLSCGRTSNACLLAAEAIEELPKHLLRRLLAGQYIRMDDTTVTLIMPSKILTVSGWR
jgi:hypothetical protein